MPSQRPLVIPPHAILDPTFCSEFGRPVFAWHSNSGRIGVAGGGLINDRAGQLRGVATSGVTQAKGAISMATGGIDFGVGGALQITSGRSTVWTMFNPANITGTPALFAEGFYLNTTTNRCYVVSQSTSAIRILHWSNTNPSGSTIITNTGIIAANTWCSVMTIFDHGTHLGVSCFKNGGNQASSANPAQAAITWTSADRVLVGSLAGSSGGGASGTRFVGLIGPMLVWRKAQPQRLAVMLDGNPAMAWWWPGKTGRAYSIPGGSVYNVALTSASGTNAASLLKAVSLTRSATSG